MHLQNGFQKSVEVVDLFCGIGGLSYGMRCQGVDVRGGFDIDLTCQYAYEYNNQAPFFHSDIADVTREQILKLYSKNAIRILAGCAPCQPFSSYAFKNKMKDPNKYDLLYEFSRLICSTSPDIVTMENVPAILKFRPKKVFQDFVATLLGQNYFVSYKIVYCPDYCIPQTRRRLVLLASKYGEITLIPPKCSPDNYKTVRDTIGLLPPIQAGETDSIDPLHKAAGLSPLNIKRIQNTPIGGSWKDWPEELKLKCHKAETGRSYGSVYGRMLWDAPSPTMTTQCTGYGNGRFGHPEQNRAISAREAALLQTFPKSYRFFQHEEEVSLGQVSRYIGNAVPPLLGEAIAESIIFHLRTISKEKPL